MSIKLDHHHRLTAQRLFSHPLCHNIQWHDVCSLLARFGEVHETHRGNWAGLPRSSVCHAATFPHFICYRVAVLEFVPVMLHRRNRARVV